ncbi:conserved hypothetical protein [Methanosalsum zhilinae DSM 4017]|uniref:Uncharacterized protein n=1 Tax=Methanosalsum zhilinae (strain DSM 4017 / NBRC 107636 / OCM 62 / WeN5) TaxID=679901 RepID=F7XNQ1_METZD|nr:hypothetical protein [Methanosalsum zhilinae]AEH61252.1 conserved hypothetical protein [Methanosalsum zhilinae DSM 4017]
MNICFFINDEKGLLEPQNDIMATAMLVVGFVVFAAIMSEAYIVYDHNSHALENYEDASRIAESLASSDLLYDNENGVISADALDHLCNPEKGKYSKQILFSSLSAGFTYTVEVYTQCNEHRWILKESENMKYFSNEVIAASVPVVIEINPVESVPGVLCVRIWN